MQGAEAYAVFFLQSLNKAAKAADPAVLTGLFTPDCVTCIAMQRSVQDLQAKRLHHAADTIAVLRATAVTYTTEKKTVLVDVDQKAVAVVSSSGKQVEMTQAGSGAFVMTVDFRKGRWIVTRLQTAAP